MFWLLFGLVPGPVPSRKHFFVATVKKGEFKTSHGVDRAIGILARRGNTIGASRVQRNISVRPSTSRPQPFGVGVGLHAGKTHRSNEPEKKEKLFSGTKAACR